jgi:hypothetical protein
MSRPIATSIDAKLPPGREQEFLDGYREMSNGDTPDGLLRSELLRGQDRYWRIQTTWRDMEALKSPRKSGKPPAALALLDRLEAEHSHTVFAVEQSQSYGNRH